VSAPKTGPLDVGCPCFSCGAPVGFNCRISAWGRDLAGGWQKKYTTRNKPHAARIRAAQRAREEKR
jgi:hypothetical protein